MSPYSSKEYGAHNALRYSKLFCDLFLRHRSSHRSNLQDVIFSYFRFVVAASEYLSVSPLCHHVRDIITVSADNEMVGVHTTRVIAAVQDVEFSWINSSCQKIRGSVR
jgi:hypothetical protein